MERRALAISIGLSCFAMYLVYQYVQTKEAELEDKYGISTMSPMVVATKDILQYQTIRPTDLDVVRVPKALVPPGRIANPQDVVDSIAAIPIKKGEQILDNKIISKNVYSGLDTQIAQKKRAISVPVNPKSSMGFLLEPGNRVDLAAHFEYKAKILTSEVKVFMQDLLVLAVGRTIQTEPPKGVDQRIFASLLPENATKVDIMTLRETINYAKKDTNYNTVTLEVTPEQAQIVVYVMTVYKESLVLLLRNSNDRQRKRVGTTNMNKIMGPNSYYVKHKQLPPPRAIARPRGYDFVGGRRVPY